MILLMAELSLAVLIVVTLNLFPFPVKAGSVPHAATSITRNVLFVCLVNSFPVSTDTVSFPLPVSYPHPRAHEKGRNLVCRLLFEKKNMVLDSREFNVEISLKYTSDDVFIDTTMGSVLY